MLELILTSLTAMQQLTFLIMALILSTQGQLEGSVMASTVLIILVSVTEVSASIPTYSTSMSYIESFHYHSQKILYGRV